MRETVKLKQSMCSLWDNYTAVSVYIIYTFPYTMLLPHQKRGLVPSGGERFCSCKPKWLPWRQLQTTLILKRDWPDNILNIFDASASQFRKSNLKIPLTWLPWFRLWNFASVLAARRAQRMTLNWIIKPCTAKCPFILFGIDRKSAPAQL